MNDRLYEIINQCFIGTTDGKLSELNTVKNVEKFAELIVRECAEIATMNQYQSYTAGHYVLKHFGIEE